jgi:hypothetical protein
MSESTEEISGEHQTPEAEKARLENAKLRAEIRSISRSAWRTPGFWAAIMPVALAAIGLIFTWGTGWFDVQRTRIDNDKTLVEAQTERLKIERTILESKADDQRRRLDDAENGVAKLTQTQNQLTTQNAELAKDRDELRLQKGILEAELKRLAGSDEKASVVLAQLRDLQSSRDQLSSERDRLKLDIAALAKTSARQLELIRQADSVLWTGWWIALRDKDTWTRFSEFREEIAKVQASSIDLLPEWQIVPETRASMKGIPAGSYEEELHDQRIIEEELLRKTAALRARLGLPPDKNN